MSPLAKKITEILKVEEDEQILGEVIHYYEFLKEKQRKEIELMWDKIEEDKATEEEIQIIQNHINSEIEETTNLDDLMKEMGINE